MKKTILLTTILLSSASFAETANTVVIKDKPQIKISEAMKNSKLTEQRVDLSRIQINKMNTKADTKAFIGNEGGGGGDTNEINFKNIAANIVDWIHSGNDESLRLPQGITLKDYETRMLAALANYHISFTSSPVLVNGAEKTCRSWVDSSQQRFILCNSDRFHNAGLEDQYRLVHHEFAGLTRVEMNNKEDSDYQVSDQISGFLQNEVVLRLPVAKQPKQPDPTPENELKALMWGGHTDVLPGSCRQYDKKKLTQQYYDKTVTLLTAVLQSAGHDVQSVNSKLGSVSEEQSQYGDDSFALNVGRQKLSYTLKNGVILDATFRSLKTRNATGNSNPYSDGYFSLGFEEHVEAKYDNDGQLVSKSVTCLLQPEAGYIFALNRETHIPVYEVNDQIN